MSRDWIFVPVIVQVLMTLLIYVRLIKVKVREMRAGKVDMARRGLHEDAWPDSVLLINNNIRNQFELPVLFYVLTILAMATRHADFLFVVLAWVFVLSRLVHAYIHVTSNNLRMRGLWFGVGALVLFIMWVIFVVRIMLGLP
jgi:hypothetical protein